jgi:hypothetical protein
MKRKLIQLFIRDIKSELCIYKIKRTKRKSIYYIMESEIKITAVDFNPLPDNPMEDTIRIIDNNFSNIKYYK